MNVAHPSRVFLEKRMGQEVPADSLGEEWAGYVLRITGGNDKQACDTFSVKRIYT